MNLQEFKKANGIDKLNLYKSTKSGRLVGSHGEISIVTSEDFDASKEIMVYSNPAAEAQGQIGFVLSNTVQREADMVL